MFHVMGVFKIFSGKGHQFSSLFQAQFFPEEFIVSNLNPQNDFGEPWAPPEKFWKFAQCNRRFCAF